MNTYENPFLPGILSIRNNIGYGNLPIPSKRDEEISDAIHKWVQLDEFNQTKFLKMIPPEDTQVLLSFSERMASLAVRTYKEHPIRLGLIALGLACNSPDIRENIMALSLLHTSADMIESDSHKLFHEAMHSLPSISNNSYFLEFLNRSAKDKSIEDMGFEESNDKDGFIFKRTW